LKIEGTPASAAEKEPGRLLHEVASTLRAAGRLPRGREVHEALARSVSALLRRSRSRATQSAERTSCSAANYMRVRQDARQ
jgi:hypothetical protein